MKYKKLLLFIIFPLRNSYNKENNTGYETNCEHACKKKHSEIEQPTEHHWCAEQHHVQ